ncbi:RDD family protein [Pedobacter sp.]|uniref:RDD family protein n=1 Tax=Pedobacter sp. TaxID=1411316 RepID=UPI003D7F5CDE
MENELYTIVINGKPQGPYMLDQLAALKIQPGTFIRKPGMDDYKEAHEFPELRALLGFTYQQTAPQYFASFDQRLLAAAIDFFLIVLAYLGVMLLFFIVVTDQTERITLFVTFSPLLIVAKFIYSSLAEASSKQGTLGKRLLSIRVTDLMGNRISIGHSFLRNAAKILSVIPFFFGYLYSFLNKKQQTWHDIAANTLVIKDRLI